MLVGKCIFDAESKKELVKKVEKGDYYLPTTLSKETVSFLNGMLQYDINKRLSADELSKHHFLTKEINEFTPINLEEVKNIIEGEKLKINLKENQLIWSLFETEGPKSDNISQAVKSDPQTNEDHQVKLLENEINDININNNENNSENDILSGDLLKEELLKAFEIMNSDFICSEYKMIPIILGNDSFIDGRPKFVGDI